MGISKLRDAKNGIYAHVYFRNMHKLMKSYGMDKQAFENKKLPNTIW